MLNLILMQCLLTEIYNKTIKCGLANELVWCMSVQLVKTYS